MADLKPANENPWYVLATLYGEQEGEEIDWELHEKNRKVWNAWAGQGVSNEIDEVAKRSQVKAAEFRRWNSQAAEVQRVHRLAMLTRNGDGFVYTGFPRIEQEIDFQCVAFDKLISCSGYVFPNDTMFTSAVFEAHAEFSSTVFRGHASFDHTAFHANTSFFSGSFGGDAEFDRAEFRGNTSFDSVGFQGDAYFASSIFENKVNFDSAKFEGNAYFISIECNTLANFRAAAFGAEAFFTSVKFKGLTAFSSVAFSTDVDFSGTAFSAGLAFDSATFAGFAYFTNAKFGVVDSETTCQPSFRDCQFEKPTNFRGAVFLHHYPDLSGAVLHEKTTFTAKAECWPDAKAWQFESHKLQLKWTEESKDSCAAIRHVLAQQGLPEEEHFFFRREMRFAGQVGSRWARVPYQAFGVLSDYGISIARPVTFLAATFVLPLGAYTAVFENRGGALSESVLSALGLSLASTLKFFGFQRLYFSDLFKDPGALISVLTGTQTVLGYVFLFFLALGLRQRFRLR